MLQKLSVMAFLILVFSLLAIQSARGYRGHVETDTIRALMSEFARAKFFALAEDDSGKKMPVPVLYGYALGIYGTHGQERYPPGEPLPRMRVCAEGSLRTGVGHRQTDQF